jgi:hypothetical protein
MNLSKFTDNELIEHVYTDLAGAKLREEMTDWADGKNWKQVVSKLPRPVQLVYRIAILNMQVMNGGFIQYFDNRYGIFAYETLKDFKLINANKSYELLDESLSIINSKDYRGERFFRFIFGHEYNSDWDALADKLEPLDEKWYALDGVEHLESLIGSYLRKKL